MPIADNLFVITPDTWIISDTHFFHENIGKYCNRPERWQELIIKNWNDRVSPDDTILHLGDFALGKKSQIELLAGMLNGSLLLIQGNHDQLSQSFCEAHGVTLPILHHRCRGRRVYSSRLGNASRSGIANTQS
ncbi:MAG: metallophosphoesterase [Anaerolineaceae bacterium]